MSEYLTISAVLSCLSLCMKAMGAGYLIVSKIKILFIFGSKLLLYL